MLVRDLDGVLEQPSPSESDPVRCDGAFVESEDALVIATNLGELCSLSGATVEPLR
jgi:hypothetical protein